MRFFIYSRPLLSIKRKENMGILIHISLEDKVFSPDGEYWHQRKCSRSVAVYDRLLGMLRNGGMGDDMIFPLEGRTLKDLLTHMSNWERGYVRG